MDLDELRRRISAGERFQYLCFYGHKPTPRVSASCLSQWYFAPFVLEGERYATAESWMMAAKARLFGDQETLEKILRTDDPRDAKALGREVSPFDTERWSAERRRLVTQGNLAKFSQHPRLRAFLDATGDQVLVEASPTDRIWGIGLKASDPRAGDPEQWRGLNLLGFALMDVRDALRSIAPRPSRHLTLERVRSAAERRGMRWSAESAEAPFTHDIVGPAIADVSESLWRAFHAHWQERGLDFFREHYGAPLGFVIERANAVLVTLDDEL